jgi:hypothetical protein
MRSAVLHKKFWLGLAFLTLAGLLGSMTLTTPQSIGPKGVLVWFLGFYAAVTACLIVAGAYVFRRGRDLEWIDLVRAAGWSVAAVALLALRSLGQLQIRDIALIVGLILVLSVYSRALRRRS